MKKKRKIKVLFANFWQGRKADLHLQHLEKQLRTADIIFGSEVEAQMSGDKIAAEKHPMYARVHDGKVMINHANVLIERYQNDFYYEYAGENERTYDCRATGNIFEHTQYGNIVLISKRLKVVTSGSVFIFGTFAYRGPGGHSASPRALQYVVTEENDIRYLFAHFHGLWIAGNTKGDCPERDEQSAQVLATLRLVSTETGATRIIFGGDFNLDIDTRALQTLENGFADVQFNNAIKGKGITGTRSRLYRHFANPDHSNYADYVLHSLNVRLHTLLLCGARTSDHLHLLVEVT